MSIQVTEESAREILAQKQAKNREYQAKYREDKKKNQKELQEARDALSEKVTIIEQLTARLSNFERENTRLISVLAEKESSIQELTQTIVDRDEIIRQSRNPETSTILQAVQDNLQKTQYIADYLQAALPGITHLNNLAFQSTITRK